MKFYTEIYEHQKVPRCQGLNQPRILVSGDHVIKVLLIVRNESIHLLFVTTDLIFIRLSQFSIQFEAILIGEHFFFHSEQILFANIFCSQCKIFCSRTYFVTFVTFLELYSTPTRRRRRTKKSKASLRTFQHSSRSKI